jgi:hypothetical protein
MKKILFLFILLAIASGSCSPGGGSERKIARLREINKKSCMQAWLSARVADSATVSAYCDCFVGKMFELYSYEEILRWGDLPSDERQRREAMIEKECGDILQKTDTLQQPAP